MIINELLQIFSSTILFMEAADVVELVIYSYKGYMMGTWFI